MPQSRIQPEILCIDINWGDYNQWRELWFANEAANDPDRNGIHPVLALAS